MEDGITDGAPWLPDGEQDLVDLCKKWKIGLNDAAAITSFGWKQADVSTALTTVDGFLTARDAYELDNSTNNRMLKDDAKKAAKDAMRDFARYSIRFNRLMSREQKLYYGVRTADPKPSPTPAPNSYPEAEADTSVIRQVTIRFWDSATKRRAKPHGVHGAEIRWAILDHVPASVNELIHSSFDTASPFTLVFDAPEAARKSVFLGSSNRAWPDAGFIWG
jgi:hypothetical protein